MKTLTRPFENAQRSAFLSARAEKQEREKALFSSAAKNAPTRVDRARLFRFVSGSKTHTHTHTHTQRERERERETDTHPSTQVLEGLVNAVRGKLYLVPNDIDGGLVKGLPQNIPDDVNGRIKRANEHTRGFKW